MRMDWSIKTTFMGPVSREAKKLFRPTKAFRLSENGMQVVRPVVPELLKLADSGHGEARSMLAAMIREARSELRSKP